MVIRIEALIAYSGLPSARLNGHTQRMKSERRKKKKKALYSWLKSIKEYWDDTVYLHPPFHNIPSQPTASHRIASRSCLPIITWDVCCCVLSTVIAAVLKCNLIVSNCGHPWDWMATWQSLGRAGHAIGPPPTCGGGGIQCKSRPSLSLLSLSLLL